MGDAKVFDLNVARIRRDLKASLDMSACVARAKQLRDSAMYLDAAGLHEAAEKARLGAARAMRLAETLAARQLLKGTTNE